jgi:hypothetical protein
MFLRSRLASLALLSGLVFGCSDEAEMEEFSRVEYRIVPLNSPCPSGETAASLSEGQADSGELVSEHPLRRKPVCWYRVQSARQCDRSEGSLEALRAQSSELLPLVRYDGAHDVELDQIMCTDEGLVLRVMSNEGPCREVIERRRSWETQRFGLDSEDIPGDLIAADERPGLTVCTYELTGTRSAHAASSSGSSSCKGPTAPR